MNQKRAGWAGLVFWSVLALAIVPVAAGPIDFDKWYNFRTEAGANFPPGVDLGDGEGFAVGHSSFEPSYFAPGDPPWTFEATGFGAILTVVDGGEHGDIYSVWDYDSGTDTLTFIGNTSEVTPNIGVSCGGLPEPCLSDPGGWSSGSFFLAPGSYAIRISIFDTPYETSNLSWFRVTAAEAPPPSDVPEPGTLGLLGAGLLLVGAFGRRWQAGQK